MSTSSFTHPASVLRAPVRASSSVLYALAAAALSALVLAIALTGSPSSHAWAVKRVTPHQAAGYARALSAQPGATASGDLAEQPGIVRTNAPATAFSSPATSTGSAQGNSWFSVPGHHR